MSIFAVLQIVQSNELRLPISNYYNFAEMLDSLKHFFYFPQKLKGIIAGFGIVTIALVNLSIFFGLEAHEHTEVRQLIYMFVLKVS